MSRSDSLPRPSDAQIRAFYDEIGLDEVLAAVEAPANDTVVRFQTSVTANMEYDNAKNYEMLRLGDYIVFELVERGFGDMAAQAVFCGHPLGLINADEADSYGIAGKLCEAEAGVFIGDRVYARVAQIAGGQREPQAVLDVFYVETSEGLNIVNDVLLSRDGKKALRYRGDGDALVIPEGVEAIRARAFYKLEVQEVTFPNTLREIGERAFGLCGCREYRIPAGVEKIGDGAFSFCFKSVLCEGRDNWQGVSATGPVHVEVEKGNERYFSVDGSLIERNGDQRRLLSLWYDGAPQRPYSGWHALGKNLNVAVPKGVTALAPYCVSAARGYVSINLTLPDSLTTVEKKAFVVEGDKEDTRLHFRSINVPAGLVDVGIDFWDSCAEGNLCGLCEDYGEVGMDLFECTIRIDPANPRFLVVGQKFYDKSLISDEDLRAIQSAAGCSEFEGSLADHFESGSGFGFSIDAYDFAPKLFSICSLTFGEGQRATAPEFTMAIPDGWRVFYAREEGERAFRAYADESVLWEDIDDLGEYAYDGLFYCHCPMPTPMPEETKADLQDRGIDEYVRVLRRMVHYGDANLMAKCFDIVRGKNCYVMVIDDRPYLDGYCVQICPCMPFSGSYVRLNCPNQSNADKDAAFAKAIEIAKTVELTEPLVCDVLAAVERSGREKVSADEFVGAAARLVNTLYAVRNLEREPVGQRFLCEAKRDFAAGTVTVEEIQVRNHQVMLDFLSDFSERVIHYMFDLLDAYGFQKASGASPDELREMIGAINDGMELFDCRLTADDPAEQAEIDALGSVKKPADWPRLRALVDAEMGALGMEVPEVTAEVPPEVPTASDEPVGEEAVDGEAEREDSAASTTESSPSAEKDSSPQIDQALFAITMLAGDWIWFNPTQIGWDGEHHVCKGADINATKMSGFGPFLATEYPGCFSSINEAMILFGKLACGLEQDEALRVPREMIAPGLHEALREGDLTGLTLLNFAACGSAIMLREQGDTYVLLFDTRLANGIPGFFDLCARMVWDLRAMNTGGEGTVEVKPFTLTFAGVRNLDADEFLDDVRETVAGAQKNPGFLLVSEAPVVAISGAQGCSEDGAGNGDAAGNDALTDLDFSAADEEETAAELRALDQISAWLPEQLVDCLEMCLRNVVGFEFYERVFEQLKDLALEEFDAAGCEAVCWLAVQALRAQAFKGAAAEDLELMQIEAESVAVELNAVHGFDLQGAILREA